MKKQKHLLLFMLSVAFLLVAGMAVGGILTDGMIVAKFMPAVGLSMASFVFVGNIDAAPNAERAGKQVRYKVFVLPENYYDENSAFPEKVNGVRGSIPLLASKYWSYIGAIDDTIEPGSSAEAGDLATTIKNSLPFNIGGVSYKVRHLLEGGIGEKFFVGFELCGTGKKYLMGTRCKPMILKSFDGGTKKDYTGFQIQFENEDTQMWCEYNGNFTVVAPATVDADATTITLSTADIYQLTDGSAASAAITGVGNGSADDHGRIIEILGSGGSNASTIETATGIILIDGTTWTANAGSRISFQIFKDGEASYKLIEVPGTRVQTA